MCYLEVQNSKIDGLDVIRKEEARSNIISIL